MSTVAEPSALQLIRDLMPSLSGAKLRVAEVILGDPLEAGRNSITWLAEQASTQPAAITRLSRALGYSGFRALRAAVANEAGRELQAGWASDVGTDIGPLDTPEHVISTLAGHDFRALRNAMAALDIERLTAAADRIASASRVEVFGEWGDLPTAQELTMRLKRIGVPVWAHDGSYSAQVGAGLLGEGDVALAISRSGEAAVADAFLAVAAKRGATTIVITGTADSLIGRRGDIVLCTGAGGGRTWIEYFAERASDDFLAGVLWVLVAQRLNASFTLPE